MPFSIVFVMQKLDKKAGLCLFGEVCWRTTRSCFAFNCNFPKRVEGTYLAWL